MASTPAPKDLGQAQAQARGAERQELEDLRAPHMFTIPRQRTQRIVLREDDFTECINMRSDEYAAIRQDGGGVSVLFKRLE